MSADVKRVLYFTKSAGFEHGTVHRDGDELAPTEKLLSAWGPEHGFEVVCSKDGSLFTPEYLAGFDAYIFCTTGILSEEGTDKQPPFPPGGKDALLAAIAGGKGFVGIHNASDTFHGKDCVDPYIAMLGGEFATHGAQQVARQELVSSFPGIALLHPIIESHDEWYVQRNLAKDLHVVLLQHTEGMTGEMYEGKPAWPSAWARRHGAGRVFYIAMGHRPDNFEDAVFLMVLGAALDWATGRVDADVTPNIAQVAPGCPTV
jgi:type 1 glutamine amidotransferase